MSAAVPQDLPLASSGELPFNKWVVALTVTLATFMEVLDTSIANVALPHIAGNLSATHSESTWVLTSYLVSNAVVLPLSGWLSGVMGRKRFYMTCVVIFTLSSALCGMAGSLSMLVFFRILQGVGGGGLQPSEQAILVDTFPPAKRGMAMAVYTIAILVAPVFGPTLGGWITDNFSWRWIFYINVPVGCLSLILTKIVLRDPPHMIARRLARRGMPFRLDYIGLSLIALGLASLELVLDKGQEDDWFSSRFILIFSIIAGAALVLAVVWELRHPHPIVNLHLFADRNFRVACVVIYFAFACLYATTVLLPQMLQTLMGYSATEAGWVLGPSALAAMAEMPVIGILLARGVDARKLIIPGLLVTSFSALWMSHLNLQVAESQVIWPRVVQVMGAGLMFVPINTLAYRFIPKEQTNNASGLFSLVRNEGASIGVALVTTLLDRHTQIHQSNLAQHVQPTNPIFTQTLARLGGISGSGAGSTVLATGSAMQRGLRVIYGLVQQQAGVLSYMDLFRLFAFLMLMVCPLVLLMHRGGHEAVELSPD